MRNLIYIICVALVGSSLLLGGCNWMGRTAGTAKASVENGIDAVQEGYHEGYSETKEE